MCDNIIEKLRSLVSEPYKNDGKYHIEDDDIPLKKVIVLDEQIDGLAFHESWEDKGLYIIARATRVFSLVINDSKRIYRLEIKGVCCLNGLSLTDSEIPEVEIKGTIENQLYVSSCVIDKMSLKQANTSQNFISHFHVANKTTIDNLVIDKYLCKNTNSNASAILIDKSTVKSLSIKHTTFHYVKYSGAVVNMFFSNQSTFGKVSIEDIDYVEGADYNEQRVSKSENVPIRTINLFDSKIDHLVIEGGQTEEIYLESTTIRQGLISDIENKGCISLTGYIPMGSFLQFNDVKAGLLSFQNFTNFGDLRFINVGKKDDHTNDTHILQIRYSDLGKTHFYNCDFGGKDAKIDFANSRIQDIVILGHAFPCKINSAGSSGKNHESELLLLSQLSGVFQKNNDIANEIGYRGLALDALRKQRNYKRRADGVAIWLNKVSNNHSDGLGRSFLILLVSSIVLYVIYVYLRGYTIGADWDATWFIIGSYFEFLSPIHKANYLVPRDYFVNRSGYNILTEQVSGYIYFISGVSKIIISYLIYQFIQAFRKYGRRN